MRRFIDGVANLSFALPSNESPWSVGLNDSCVKSIATDPLLIKPRMRAPEGGILFELCRFLYTGEVCLDRSDKTGIIQAGLLLVAGVFRIDSLFHKCADHLRSTDISDDTFYYLEQAVSSRRVYELRHRIAVLDLLRSKFGARYERISSRREFPSIISSTLLELCINSAVPLPVYLLRRWNQFCDKDAETVGSISELLAHGVDPLLSCSLVESPSGNVICEGARHILANTDVNIVVYSVTETSFSWRISGLVRGRQLGLFNSFLLIRQTHAEGIYEIKLQDGSAHPPTAYIAGSSMTFSIRITFGGRRIAVHNGHIELMSSFHEFHTMDIRLIYDGKCSDGTTIELIDKISE